MTRLAPSHEGPAVAASRDAPPAEPVHPGDVAPAGTPGTGKNVCRRCSGSGRVDAAICPECQGSGKVIEGIGGG